MIRIKRVTVIIALLLCVLTLALVGLPGKNPETVSASISNNPKIILDAGHEGLNNTMD